GPDSRVPLVAHQKLVRIPFALLMIAALAATAAAPARAGDADSSRRTQAYRIRSTDKLSIRVFQEDDLTTICRVDSKGTVNLPLVGEVRVYGQTLSEAEHTIREAYKNGRFLRDPEVTVAVEEY